MLGMTVITRAAVLILLLCPGVAAAQEIGQPGRGLAAAERLCAECHAVRPEQERSPRLEAPRFQVIAAVPGMTSIALTAALATSHRTMPNVMLEPEERADIIAYILSLK
jgi:mono/diheme cytochrome c family protein